MFAIELIHPLEEKAIQSWTFDRAQRSISIGRSRKNDIPLASAVVSRSHATIERDATGWCLKPVGANGCFIGGKLVTRAYLLNDQVVRVARSGPRLRVVYKADTAATPLLQQRQESRESMNPKDTLSIRDTYTGYTRRENS